MPGSFVSYKEKQAGDKVLSEKTFLLIPRWSGS